MPHTAFPALALFALAPVAAADQPREGSIDGVELAQVTIHQRVIIRIPRMPRAQRSEAPLHYEERGGPKCVPLATLDRAIITSSETIDLMFEDGERMRAHLEGDCPALDFYPDLYVKPTSDGKVCAGRDAIRSRSGGVCPIDGFKRMVAKR